MATETKKYLSLDRLAEYDQLIKAKMFDDINAATDIAKGYADDLVGDIPTGNDSKPVAEDVIGYIDYKTAGLATSANIDTLTQKVDTLIGDVEGDDEKSVREIALDELTKQLIAEDAKEALDTLQEIAAWIQSHPDDASEMNQRIVDLEDKTVLGTYTENDETKEYTTVKSYVEAVTTDIDAKLDGKVGVVNGKGLSTNDLTDTLKGNYDAAYQHSISDHAPANAEANKIDVIKVNGTAVTISSKSVDISVPTDNTQLTNGAGYLVVSDIANKADKATTLAGYGIADSYTATEIDTAITNAKAEASSQDAVVLAEAQKGIADAVTYIDGIIAGLECTTEDIVALFTKDE